MKKVPPQIVFFLSILALGYALFDNFDLSVAFVSFLLAILSGWMAWGKD